MYRINQMSLPIEFDWADIRSSLAEKIKVDKSLITYCKLSRLSIDARNKQNICYKASIVFDTNTPLNLERMRNVEKYTPHLFPKKYWLANQKEIIVVGSGPSGLFTALVLAEAGAKVTILERGYEMSKRIIACNKLFENGELDVVSNIQFGEGGAGTFSDGKLNTGIKSEYIDYVLETFHKYGAPENILYDSHAHIGTDILSDVVVNIRHRLEAIGVKVLFEHQLIDCDIVDGRINSIYVKNDNNIMQMPCDLLVLAIGHSSRDTIRMLVNNNLAIKQKPFSMGYRIEHLQKEINMRQYGKYADLLPPADYHLSKKLDNGRTIYTFCMCPGGVVVPAMSESGTVVTNGMSYHDRAGVNSNSAVLINVNPEDFGGDDVLAGVELQERWEKYAYEKNGTIRATVQRVGDFLAGVPSDKLGKVKPTYRPGYVLGTVEDMLPKFVVDSVKMGLPKLAELLPDFDEPNAILTGIETRSSAPYQVIRNQDMESSIGGVYAIGEGAGFAGGIVSSAVEGIKCAFALIDKYGKM